MVDAITRLIQSDTAFIFWYPLPISVITSTYLYVHDFACILSISQLNAAAVIDQIFESAF